MGCDGKLRRIRAFPIWGLYSNSWLKRILTGCETQKLSSMSRTTRAYVRLMFCFSEKRSEFKSFSISEFGLQAVYFTLSEKPVRQLAERYKRNVNPSLTRYFVQSRYVSHCDAHFNKHNRWKIYLPMDENDGAEQTPCTALPINVKHS